ncbi:MAG: GNAT family N-acetyltransferase [Candidatus Omnitrophica bacterium]|nr:GNAT family N-acetyltransferase [Candidatus Omnitrophota bacterium]
MSLTIRVIKDFDELLPLGEGWDSVVSSMEYPMPFITHSYVYLALKYLCRDKKLHVITAWDGEKLIGILPLYRSSYRMVKVFNFSCLQSLNDCSNVICSLRDLDRVLTAVKKHLDDISATWELLLLYKFPTAYKTVEALTVKLADRNMYAITKTTDDSYYIDMKGSFDEYFRGLNKKFRDNRRNMNNKMSREGKVEFEVITKYDAVSLDSFFAIEDTGWKGEGANSIKLRKQVEYYNELSRALSEKKHLLLAVLKVGGEPIAAIYGFLFNGIFYLSKIAVNYAYPGHKQFSPGQAILYRLIKYCFDEKLKRFDFYGPFYSYEAHWTRNINEKKTILVFNGRRAAVKSCVILKKSSDLLKAIFCKTAVDQKVPHPAR